VIATVADGPEAAVMMEDGDLVAVQLDRERDALEQLGRGAEAMPVRHGALLP
jgi:hypothetical protein